MAIPVEDIRRLLHDINNHLTVLVSCIEIYQINKELFSADRMLNEMSPHIGIIITEVRDIQDKIHGGIG